MTMSADLADWCDWDDAAFSYGIAIGIFEGASRQQVSLALLSKNPLGAGLHAGMLALVQAGVVERRLEPDEQFRWIFPGAASLPGSQVSGPGIELPDLSETPEPAPAEPTRHWWQRS